MAIFRFFKMAAAAILDFQTVGNLGMGRLKTAKMPNFAAIAQTLLIYDHFSIFQDGGHRHLGFSKCGEFRGAKGQDGQNASPCQISCRSVKPLLRITDVSRTITFPDRRFPDKTFPGQDLSRTRLFPDKTIPGQDDSRTRRFPDKTFPGQDVSRIITFPDKTFPGKTFPGQLRALNRRLFPVQDVSRTIIFPDRRFPDNLYK